jgi:hypothetical protein
MNSTARLAGVPVSAGLRERIPCGMKVICIARHVRELRCAQLSVSSRRSWLSMSYSPPPWYSPVDRASAPIDLLREIRRGFVAEAGHFRQQESEATSKLDRAVFGAKAFAAENTVRKIDATLRDWG